MPSPHFKGLGTTVLGIFKESKDAIFKPKNGPSVPLEVIFHARNQDVEPVKEYGQTSKQGYGDVNPVCWFNTGLINPKYQDTIVIDDIEYIIVEVSPDGLELTQLDLDVL